jgi:uncharacterized protein (TIGR02996 family)
MTDSDDLLRAVIANPEDDTPRLIFADWLDDRGDHARAEFIRVQIERWNRFGDQKRFSDPDYLQLALREKTLFSLNHDRWMEPLRKKGEPFQSRDTHGIYQRGFIHEVWMRARTFLSRSEKLFRRTPCRALKLTQANEDEFAEFSALPILSVLKSLDLTPIRWTIPKMETFLASQPLKSLARIEIQIEQWPNEYMPELQSKTRWENTEIVFHSQLELKTENEVPVYICEIPRWMNQNRSKD